MKRIIKQCFLLITLVALLLLFSAFTQKRHDEARFITRYEFAVMVDDVLKTAFDRRKIYENCNYSDLSKKQNESVFLASKLGIVSGFPDGTFHPGEKMRNVETIAYLQKLANVLIASDPELYASKQLMRLFAYNPNIKPGDDVPEGVFPHKLLELGDYSDRTSVCNIFDVLANGKGFCLFKQIEGVFVDASNGNSVINAYAAINGVAIAADSQGCFNVSVPFKDNNVDIFAVAEGYEAIDVKKDITFDRNILIKLKRNNGNF